MFIPTLIIMLIGMFNSTISPEARNSVAMSVVTLVGYINLLALCRPYTRWRFAVVGLIGGLIAVTIPISLLIGDMFGFAPVMQNPMFFFGMLGIGVALSLLLHLFTDRIEKAVIKKLDAKRK
jgi:hypothetical protein